ncbi:MULTISPECIES: LysE family translocator [Neisseria]|uniref:Homoserine/homoserine lactone efflux protein n=1 Tax=Neisseria canis TaxID=493 RepID=A0A1X3CZQ9_9NEIS|nr:MULTISPECIES: LysE family translocator [Neisseria]KPN71114.1 hypothetical protein AKG09_08095 [Neisseria sp. 83E34]OSI13149.1 hypothetical protein BWD07_02180 [Neisseria canis]VEF00900.1 Homoserine/homoserine lactone efflux protein [Neisseria canis]
MSLYTLIYFFASSLLIAALPGPAMMLAIQGALKSGWRKGIEVTIGILLADAVLLLAVCVGLGEMMAGSPKLLFIMGIAASLYLLYLGGRSLYEIRRIVGNLPESTDNAGWKTGFLITVVNPKTIVFLLAYFPQFVKPQEQIPENVQLIVLSVLFLLAVAIVMTAYVFTAHAARNQLSKPVVRRLISLMFGLLLIYIGLDGLIEVFG